MPIRRVDVAFPTIDQVAADVAGDGGNAGAISDRTAGAQGDYVLVFRTARDGRVRPEHAALEGHTWELTDPDAPSPPLAPGCRCQVEIVPRDQAERRETSTSAEALDKFKDLEKNLAQVYPADVVEAYRQDLLPADVIIQRTGDRISTAQARAIIASRRAELEPKAALQAVAALADRGLSGRVLWPIVEDAQRRIDAGAAALDAAKAALMGTVRRGSVTPRTADKAARELVRSRLIGARDPKAIKADPPKPPPKPEPPQPQTPEPKPDPVEVTRRQVATITRELADLDKRRDATGALMPEALAAAHAKVAVPDAERTAATVTIPKSRQTDEIRAGEKFFRSMVSRAALSDQQKLEVVASKARRASAKPWRGTIHVSDKSDRHTVAHEFGHLLEGDPKVKAAALAFVQRRTSGKPLVQMKGYGPSEMARDGGFIDEYVGKHYDSGYTEVVSMGMQFMSQDPIKFAIMDPDHFRFIYLLTRGILEP